MLSPGGGRAAPGGVWLYTPAGLSRIEPPVKPLRTIGCTVSSFQGGLGGAIPALLSTGCKEELGAPERSQRQEGTAGSQPLLVSQQTIPRTNRAVPVPPPPGHDGWMDGALWLGMSCSHGLQGDGCKPTSGSCSAEPKPDACAGLVGTSALGWGREQGTAAVSADLTLCSLAGTVGSSHCARPGGSGGQ